MKANDIILPILVLTALHSSASVTVIDPSRDFFTTAWAFGAPYIRDEGRDHLGISAKNPYGMDAGGSWAEVAYLTFSAADFSGFSAPVTSAILSFTTTQRSGTATATIDISAHYLLADPFISIDPNLSASNNGSYFDFQTNQIAGIIDTVTVTDYSTYHLDLTAAVNEWIQNGDSNYAYSIALAGLEGNDDNPDGWTAIVNGGYPGAATLTVTIPEPGSLLLFALGGLGLMHRRRA